MADFLKWNGKELTNKVIRAEKKALARSCLHVVRAAKVSMKKGSKGGRSKPGEVPHVETGTLKRSIGFEIIKSIGFRVGHEGHVGARLGFKDKENPTGADAATYGKFLELGTRKMAARPYLRPALRKSRFKILREFAKIL